MYIHIKNQLRLAAIILSVLLTSVSVQAKEAAKKEKGWRYEKHVPSVVNQEKLPLVKAYRQYQVMAKEAVRAEREIFEAIEKEEAIVLEKAKVYQGISVKLLSAVRSLLTEARLVEKNLKNVEAGLAELLSGKLSQEELLTKANDLIIRLYSITVYIDGTVLPEESTYQLAALSDDEKERRLTVSDCYGRALLALKLVVRLKEELAVAMREKKGEAVILRSVMELQVMAAASLLALRLLSLHCGLVEEFGKYVQVELAELLDGKLKKVQFSTKASGLAFALFFNY